MGLEAGKPITQWREDIRKFGTKNLLGSEVCGRTAFLHIIIRQWSEPSARDLYHAALLSLRPIFECVACELSSLAFNVHSEGRPRCAGRTGEPAALPRGVAAGRSPGQRVRAPGRDCGAHRAQAFLGVAGGPRGRLELQHSGRRGANLPLALEGAYCPAFCALKSRELNNGSGLGTTFILTKHGA